MSAKLYNVVSPDGERFPMTAAQLRSDPGNFIASMFFTPSGFEKPDVGDVLVREDTEFVRLIHAHLKGYEILPLKEGVIPYLSDKATLSSLLVIAEKYGLQILHAKIENMIDKEKRLWNVVRVPAFSESSFD